MSELSIANPAPQKPANLWAVTSYFNPMGYRRRRQNYRVFHERLQAPLATIELSFNGQFELGAGDADLLIQLHGGDVMWQKERLLNLAIARLPAACTAFAWLDCDVVFADDDWPEQAVEQLREFPLLQLFGHVYDLPRDEAGFPWRTVPKVPSATSLAFGQAGGRLSETLEFVPGARTRGGRTSGLAWAMTRELWQRHKLYDARILGGGDRAIAAGACGRFEVLQHRDHMNSAQTTDYLAWAEPFYADVQGQVGSLDGNLFHLWHGNLADRRRPENRFAGFRRFDFDPQVDLCLDEAGLWRWNSARPQMHRCVRDYFAARKEDD